MRDRLFVSFGKNPTLTFQHDFTFGEWTRLHCNHGLYARTQKIIEQKLSGPRFREPVPFVLVPDKFPKLIKSFVHCRNTSGNGLDSVFLTFIESNVVSIYHSHGFGEPEMVQYIPLHVSEFEPRESSGGNKWIVGS